MKGTGPAHLFIYYQKPYKVTDQGEIEEYRGGREEFFVTDGKCGFLFIWSTPLINLFKSFHQFSKFKS